MSNHWFGKDGDDVLLAIGHSRNVVTAPGCSASPMAAEHINGLCNMLEKVGAVRDRFKAALLSITRIPETDGNGQFCKHHTTQDGEYAGTEYFDPFTVAMHMHMAAVHALEDEGLA